MTQVIGVGGLSYDLVLHVDQFPDPDSKVNSQFLGQFPGGFIANATSAVSTLGVSSGYVGWIGNDSSGEMLRDAFLESKVDVGGLRQLDNETTPFTVVMVNAQGNRTILVPSFPLYNESFDDHQLDYLRSGYIIYTYPRSVQWCQTLLECITVNRGHLVLDIEHSGHLSAEDLQEIIQMTTICFVSDDILSVIGIQSIEEIATDGWIIRTMGANGAEAYSKSTGLIYEPAVLTDVVDSTGAGDCFHAGIVASYLWNKQLPEALRFASVASSIKIQHLGARNGLPTRPQVESQIP